MTTCPDQGLVERTAAALTWWAGRADEPTSALAGLGAVGALERDVAARLGVRHGFAVPSGTLALRVALAAAGAGPERSVISAAFDWPAASAAAVDLGARMVAADVEPTTGTIDPDAVRVALRPDTVAVVATHLNGIPADLTRLRHQCDAAGVTLIEDVSHAVGASHAGRAVGSWGHLACCSCDGGKPIDALGGGVIVTADDDLFDRVVALAAHPHRQLLAGLEPTADTLALRIHPLAAIVGLHDLQRLDDKLAEWRLAVAEVESLLSGHGMRLLGPRPGDQATWWRMPVTADDAHRSVVLGPHGYHLLDPHAPAAKELHARLWLAQHRAR